jgi:hypothetical protein
MAASDSPEVRFDGIRAVPVGGPGAYTGRPGFAHGGAGVAACWYGGARGVGAGGFRPLRTAEDHALLGAVTEAGCRVLRASDLPVRTSSRRHARAPDGFGALLRTLSPAIMVPP